MQPTAASAPPLGWMAKLKSATDLGGASRVALFTLFGLNLVDEFDRIAFSTLTPEIRDAFDLTDEQIVAVGSISSVFVLLAAIPVGYLADRFARVRMARIAAIVWGSMAVLMGVGVVGSARVRGPVLLGVAKSSNDIVHTGLLADYYEPRLHPRVFQIHRVANPLSFVAALASGLIGATLGWRWAFLLLAIPTFILLVTMSKLEEPNRGQSIDPGRGA